MQKSKMKDENYLKTSVSYDKNQTTQIILPWNFIG